MPRGDAHDGRRVRSDEAGRTALVVLLSVVLLLAAGGYAAYDRGVFDRYLGRTEPLAPAAIPPPPGLEIPDAPPARPVLEPVEAGAASTPRPRELRSHLRDSLRDDDFGPHLGVLVQRLDSNRDLLRVGGDDLFIPASTLKLLTTTAALEVLGPRHRFRTTVVRGEGRRSIVLVGGGDPLLTERPPPPEEATYPEPATLRGLARRTAASLSADGVRSVRLGYDTSLFSGPAVNPSWEPSYVPDDVVSPITALWVDEGREAPASSVRSDDPAQAAADAFATQLRRAGIRVRGTPVERRAPRSSRELARVRSAPLDQVVQHVIELSDNEGAEVLLRHVALGAGLEGSSAAGARAVTRTLTGLGLDLSRARIHDGSGLSRANRLPLDALVGTLQIAGAPAEQRLRRVLTGLPVAGFNGSLAFRFLTFGAEGRGDVRAKTGTLTGVHALAGVSVDRDGTPLVYVAVADQVPPIDTLDARAGLDQLTADIAACCP
ncbi:MAG: D-alanyl-D-alanine carboxypeptidase/D-alanyl-D-alanine endopeptidase [Nocardioidaceae bacterium]